MSRLLPPTLAPWRQACEDDKEMDRDFQPEELAKDLEPEPEQQEEEQEGTAKRRKKWHVSKILENKLMSTSTRPSNMSQTQLRDRG